MAELNERFIHQVGISASLIGDPDAEFASHHERKGNCPMIAEVIGRRIAMDIARIFESLRDELPGDPIEGLRGFQQVIAEAWDEDGNPNDKWI